MQKSDAAPPGTHAGTCARWAWRVKVGRTSQWWLSFGFRNQAAKGTLNKPHIYIEAAALCSCSVGCPLFLPSLGCDSHETAEKPTRALYGSVFLGTPWSFRAASFAPRSRVARIGPVGSSFCPEEAGAGLCRHRTLLFKYTMDRLNAEGHVPWIQNKWETLSNCC